MIQPPRSAEHYARVERERFKTEPFLTALIRIAVEDAIFSVTTEVKAAELVGCSQARISKILQVAREHRVHRALGVPRRKTNSMKGVPWSAARRERHELMMAERRGDRFDREATA
jgi:hypothetical protein